MKLLVRKPRVNVRVAKHDTKRAQLDCCKQPYCCKLHQHCK